MELTGSAIHNSSFRFRMYAIVLGGLVAFGSVMHWRGQTLLSSDYQDVPVFHYEKGKNRPHAKSANAKMIDKALEDEGSIKKAK